MYDELLEKYIKLYQKLIFSVCKRFIEDGAECENDLQECDIEVKKIVKNSKKHRFDFISTLKVASFVIVCVFCGRLFFQI